VVLEVLMPPNLPRVSGTAVVFERALLHLVRRRMQEAIAGRPITLLARTLGGESTRGLLVSIADQPDGSRRDGPGTPPEAVQQAVAAMGGEVVCVEDSILGRVTALRLGVATP
jgi:hypothetical protein